jgi:hypothetical protein
LGYSDTEDRPVIHDGATTGGLPLALKNENGIHVVGQVLDGDLSLHATDQIDIPIGSFVLPANTATPVATVGFMGKVTAAMSAPTNRTKANFYMKVAGESYGAGTEWPGAELIKQYNEWEFRGHISFFDSSGMILIAPSSLIGPPGATCIVSAPSVTVEPPNRHYVSGIIDAPAGDVTVDTVIELGISMANTGNFSGTFHASADLRIFLP